jgi:hypothetical protein
MHPLSPVVKVVGSEAFSAFDLPVNWRNIAITPTISPNPPDPACLGGFGSVELATARQTALKVIVLGPGFGAVAQCDEEDRALAFGVRREERSNVIVEECEAGGAQVLSVSGEIQFAADDAGFQLHSAISAIAVTLQDGTKISEEENVDGGVGRESLLQSEVAGLVAEVAWLQTFKHSTATVEYVSSGL